METADPVFDDDVFLYSRLRHEAESDLAVELGDRGQDGTLAGDGVKPAGDSGLQTED